MTTEPTHLLPLVYDELDGRYHATTGALVLPPKMVASLVPASRVTIADPEPEPPETERVPWWEAKGRRLPDGRTVTGVHDDKSRDEVPYLVCISPVGVLTVSEDGTVEVLIERTPGDERPTPADEVEPEPADDGPPRVGDTVTVTRWVDEEGDTITDVDDPLVATVAAVDEDCACIESEDEGLYLARHRDCTVTKRADR